MKRIVKISLIVLFLITFCGCSKLQSNNSGTTITAENKSNKTIYYQQNGKLTDDSSCDKITIVSTENDKEALGTNIYLVAETPNNEYVYDLGKAEYNVLRNGSLNVFDIDNDGIDEILLFMEITSNGGTITQMFKIENDSIKLMCDFNEYNLNINCYPKADKVMTIENESINFLYDIDISKEYDSSYFDDTGRVLLTPQIFTLPIDCLNVDTSDGSTRIYCNYGIKIHNYVGDLKVGFQNNEIVSMAFTPTG